MREGTAAVRFLAPYAGYPAAEGLERLGAVAAALGADGQAAAKSGGAPETRDEPREPDDGCVTTDAWLAAFTTSRTERAWAEPGLSARECAYLALAADVAQQTLGPSFRAHVARALACGARPAQVRDVIRFLAECGIARAAAALCKLEAILGEHPA
jgi:alkylhydroperoxidase/carboxymuconolactone decarboxylase family protein YurZ